MKRELDVSALLIQNAIHLIAEGGFEAATTKNLTHCGGSFPDFKMNEVYIYRLFGSKEHLLEQAFIYLDRELFVALQSGLDSIGGAPAIIAKPKESFFAFMKQAWAFLLKNEERCRCYVRFYYSVYFKGEARECHKRLFRGIKDVLGGVFKEEVDADAVIHSVFTTMFDFAIRVYNGELEDSEDTCLHVFNVLYCMMMTYLKDSTIAPVCYDFV